MKKFIVFIVLAFIFVDYAGAKEQKGSLSQSYNTSVGDWAAYRLSEMIRITPFLQAPCLTIYDKRKNVILVEIYGSHNYIGNAKVALQGYWDFVKDFHIPDMNKNFGVELSENDYVIVYFYGKFNEKTKEIIRFEKGKMLLPQ